MPWPDVRDFGRVVLENVGNEESVGRCWSRKFAAGHV